MDNCNDIQAKLTDYHFGELSEAERQLVAAHVGSCAGCREELAELQRVVGDIETAFADVPAAPEHLSEDRLRTVYNEAVAVEADGPEPIRIPRGVWMSLAASILVVLVVTAVISLNQPPAPTVVAQREAVGEIPEAALDPAASSTADTPTAAAPTGGERRAAKSAAADDSAVDALADAGKDLVADKAADVRKQAEAAKAEAQAKLTRKAEATLERADVVKKQVEQDAARGREELAAESMALRQAAERELEKLAPAPMKKSAPAPPERPAAAEPQQDSAPGGLHLGQAPAADSKTDAEEAKRSPKPRAGIAWAPARNAKELARAAEKARRKQLGGAGRGAGTADEVVEPIYVWAGMAYEELADAGRKANMVVLLPQQDQPAMGRPLPGKALYDENTTAAVLKKSERPVHRDPAAYELVWAAARKNGLDLTLDAGGMILTPAPADDAQITKTVTVNEASGDRLLRLKTQLESLGIAVARMTFDRRRNKLSVSGNASQMKEFEELLAFGAKRRNKALLGPALPQPEKPEGGVNMTVARNRHLKYGTRSKGAAAAAESGAAGPSDLEQRLAKTMIPNVKVHGLSVNDALVAMGKHGRVPVENRAGKVGAEVGIYANNLSVRDGFRLICRAADLQVEIGSRKVTVRRGPYTGRKPVRLLRLTRWQEDKLGRDDPVSAGDARRALERGAGMTLSSARAEDVEYNAEDRILIIRADADKIRRAEAFLATR